jgi:hypothetical protein
LKIPEFPDSPPRVSAPMGSAACTGPFESSAYAAE